MQLTLGVLLSQLHALSRKYLRNQILFFQLLFAAYCRYMCTTNYPDWIPNQSVVSKLLHDQPPLLRNLRQYYVLDNSAALRDDVQRYLATVAPTAKEREQYHTHLIALVNSSTNLHPTDKVDILQHQDIGNTQSLVDLLHYLLHILLCYSSD